MFKCVQSLLAHVSNALESINKSKVVRAQRFTYEFVFVLGTCEGPIEFNCHMKSSVQHVGELIHKYTAILLKK